MAILKGLGRFDFSTIGLSENLLLPMEPVEFEMTTEVETRRSRKYVDGVIVTAGSAIASETHTMTIGIEAINWLTMQFAYGELAGTTASVELSEIKYATVPSTSPYEITDTDVTANTVQATITRTGTGWGGGKALKRAAGQTPTAGEFRVDTTANKLIFHSSAAGAPITYRVLKSHANLDSIGAETVFQTLSAFRFEGIGYTDEERFKIVAPRLEKSGVPSLSVADVTSFSIAFDMVVASGQRRPFLLYRLP